MKQLLLFLALTILSFSYTQQLPAWNKAEWQDLKNISVSYRNEKPVPQYAIDRYPVYKLASGWYVSLFGKTHNTTDWSAFREAGVLIGTSVNGVTTIKVPLEQLAALDFSSVYSYLEIPSKIQPHLDRAVKDTRADSVQHGWGLPEAFTGKDVFIGVTDWGFDYTHPMFYDTLLQASRVFAAWDQYKQLGDTPSGYAYGVEYDSWSELSTAGSDTANIYSYHTHGNHVAGIAGGSGGGTPYRGFAFESQFLFATFLIDAASVIDAFAWMKSKADAEGKRLVINMSWGLTYMGTLDGNSLLSEAIAGFADENVVFVGSAGNNGDVNYHIKKTFNNDEITSRINFYDYAANPNMWGQSITMWGEAGQPFSAGIEVYNNSGTLLNASPLYSTATQTDYLDSILVIGSDTVYFNLAAEASNPLNSRPSMRLRVNNRHTALRIVLRSSAVAGTVHYWNVTELTTGVGNWGMPFTGLGNAAVAGDALYSIGEPSCSPDVIAVGAYTSSYINGQGNPAGGAMASFTSSGPLYTEVMKPDISAPGVNVISSISSFTDADYNTTETTTFNGTDYDFAKFSGTSMASPCVAGIVALLLDASPSISPDQVKTILQTTARLDSYTGTITAPGHPRWGMGKVNAYQAVLLALNTVGLEELQADNWAMVYPNPATDEAWLLLPEGQTATTITLVAMNGQIIRKALENGRFDCSNLPAGTYLVETVTEKGILRTRFVRL